MTEEDQTRRITARQCLRHYFLHQGTKTTPKDSPLTKTSNKTLTFKKMKKQPVVFTYNKALTFKKTKKQPINKSIKKITKIFKAIMALQYIN